MANLTRYNPFDETFDDLLKGFFVRPVSFDEKAPPQVGIRMDVTEGDKAYVVHAEIPGVKKEDIHVTIEGNLIQNITKYVHLIRHVHLADVPGRHEPGTGEINFLNVLRAVIHAGYKGYAGLEYIPTGDHMTSLKNIIIMKLRHSFGALIA